LVVAGTKKFEYRNNLVAGVIDVWSLVRVSYWYKIGKKVCRVQRVAGVWVLGRPTRAPVTDSTVWCTEWGYTDQKNAYPILRFLTFERMLHVSYSQILGNGVSLVSSVFSPYERHIIAEAVRLRCNST
jgi:hypothetical protein